MASAVDIAVATMTSIVDIFSADEFAAVFASFVDAMGSIAGSMFGGMETIGKSIGYSGGATIESNGGFGGNDPQKAADQINDAWKSIVDSLIDEARRIRGEMADAGPNSLAYWQTQFAIDTAKARAGDEEAARRLTGLSRSMISAAEKEAASMLEVQRIRAAAAQSLEDTAWLTQGFVSGDSGAQRYTVNPADGPGNEPYYARAPAAAPAPQVVMPQAIAPSTGVIEVKDAQAREEVREMRLMMERLLTQINDNGSRVNNRLFRWEEDGRPPVRASKTRRKEEATV